MDRQDPPTDPAVNLLGVFIMFRQRKRCYDVTLSRQEGSTTRHLASAQSKDRWRHRTSFSDVWRAGLADRS